MIKRIGLLLMAALVAVMMLAASAMPVMAAPITCPGGADPVNLGQGEFGCPAGGSGNQTADQAERNKGGGDH